GIFQQAASLENLEVAKRLLDGGAPLGRARVDPGGGLAVVSSPEREADQVLDVSDPARPRAEAVARMNECTDLAVGGRTLGAVPERDRPCAVLAAGWRWGFEFWFQVGSNAPGFMDSQAMLASTGRFVSTCSFVLFRLGALVKIGTLKQQVSRLGS